MWVGIGWEDGTQHYHCSFITTVWRRDELVDEVDIAWDRRMEDSI